jgi:hypothetical protein
MTDVFRHKSSWRDGKILGGYLFHAVFAVLAMWLLLKAVAA